MQLTKGQSDALKMVSALIEDESNTLGILTGYAGTGKTTLLKFIAQAYGTPIILTPTGKAAIRVAEATDLPAQTIHRWMYKPIEDPKTGVVYFIQKVRKEIETTLGNTKLVIIDEASMLNKDIFNDILNICKETKLSVLLVGDPFQLPPIIGTGEERFSALNEPCKYKVALTEVVRQALDNPIIHASIGVRKSDLAATLAVSSLPRIQIGAFLDEAKRVIQSNGVVIAHKNQTRQSLNGQIRNHLGRQDGFLHIGEPLLVMYNNYMIDRFNGEVVTFNGWEEKPSFSVEVHDRFTEKSKDMSFGVASVEGHSVSLSPEEVFAVGEDMSFKLVTGYFYRNKDNFTTKVKTHLNANLGYCLTCHKSQGSEWGEVIVVIEPSSRYLSYEGRRWLYTALTRAKEKVQFYFKADDGKDLLSK
jgi:exodeoxyribonuclease-5